MNKVVLFVDDEASILGSIKRVFRKADFELLTAGSANEALAILRIRQVSVLVSDYSMPEVNGAELLKQARNIQPDMVRIILTGNNDQESVVRAINEGAVSRFLNKPWDDKKLLEEVNSALQDWEVSQYAFPEKQVLNQQAYIKYVEGQIKTVSDHNQYVVRFAVSNLETLRQSLGLETVTQCLEDITPERDLYGDDITLSLMDDLHFCALVSSSSTTDEPDVIVSEFLEKFESMLSVGDQNHRYKFYVGYSPVAKSENENGVSENAFEYLKKATIAYEMAVRDDATGYIACSEKMSSEKSYGLNLDSQLHSALANEEFVLYYQPKIDTSNNTLYGAEALIRWKSPTLGFVPPFEFIPVAEKSDLINDIGEWVAYEASRQWLEWFNDVEVSPSISVNVSAKQLAEKKFISRIQNALSESKINAANLELEITENILMNDIDKSIDVLLEAKELGVKLSIDDFGTGYSSLNYLSRLPVDSIKLDRSFILPLDESKADRQLVKNLIQLGHDLDMQIVAEGVETEHQLELLKAYGCDVIQGYFFSPPIPAADFIQSTAVYLPPSFSTSTNFEPPMSKAS